MLSVAFIYKEDSILLVFCFFHCCDPIPDMRILTGRRIPFASGLRAVYHGRESPTVGTAISFDSKSRWLLVPM